MILGLGVCDGAVLLSEVKPQLTLVSEVEVTFFTLRQKNNILESIKKKLQFHPLTPKGCAP